MPHSISKKEEDMDIINRIIHPPGHSFFLFGPRGTGKTTWLTQQIRLN